jgi:CubicO group peptidase (beta-lactamase class C family)
MSLRPPTVDHHRSRQETDSGSAARASRRRSVWLGGIAVLVAVGLIVGVVATVLRDDPQATSPAPGHAEVPPAPQPAALAPVDSDEVAAFMGAAITEAMAQHDIPGGVLVLVGDGRIARAQGYGHTDLERHTPVDAASTRFDIGSVSKLLTATAVMQQVEQGTLDLHADVNTYLTDVAVPDAFDAPVTAAHLLTHTGGFAEHYMLGSTAPGPGQAEPLAESLPRFQPSRIRPPGVVHQYDNFGMALAGHLVENVTGQSFEEYVTGNILEPLGMTRSTYGQPVDGTHDVTPHEAVPGLGTTGAVPREYINMLPTGGLWTTGEDIAAFMLAHLHGGEFESARILEADTVAAMHRTQFAPHPDVAGIGYGFFEHRAGGRRGVQHGGSWVGASAHLYLLPDADLGVFVAFNHGAGVELTHTLIYDALDRFFPVARQPAVAASIPELDAGAFAGQYRWNRHDRYTFMRLISTLTVARLQVTANEDGTLATTMSPIRLLPDATWEPAGPDVFVERGGTTTLAFDSDDSRAVIGLHVAGAQLFSMDRLAWYETTGLILGLMLAFVAAASVAAVGWPAGALVRRLRRRNHDIPADLRRARRLAGLAGGLLIAFFLGLVVHFALDMGGLLAVGAGTQALLLLPLASAGLAVALAVVVARVWRVGAVSSVGRAYLTGLTLALLAFIPSLYHLRLLGFHY